MSIEDVESLFNGMQPRMITRTHTLTPDYDDGEGWTLRISAWRDKSLALMHRYAAAYVAPVPAKLDKYITKLNFYNREDGLIAMARRLQNNKPVSTRDIQKELETGKSQSLYARILKDGIRSIQMANKFWVGKISISELRKKLDIL